MTWWSVLLVPACLLLAAGLLLLTAWLEASVLCPRSVILHAVRVRKASPEHIELLVAQQAAPLLGERRVS
ncbi:MAG: hypothetical protein JWO37_723 [Acidimicrobiales bacterium]|jgi:hypothetical protein|nr:hypothetical protein [Acidimicrobiales bacterium]